MLDPLLAYRPAIEAGDGRQGVVLVRIEGDVLHVLCLLLCGGPPQDLLTGTIPCALRASALSSRHLSPRLAAREVLLLPSLVVGPPRLALLVVRAGPLHPLTPGRWRARLAVDVAPITAAADAHRHPASRAREHPRLGRRHRPGVPRALQVRPRTRSSIRLSGPSRHRG